MKRKWLIFEYIINRLGNYRRRVAEFDIEVSR